MAIRSKATVLILALSQPLGAATDYLLSESPATGSLKQQGTSYGAFGAEDGFGGRFGALLREGGPLRHHLRQRYPSLHELFAGAEISLRPRSYYRYVRKPGGIEQEAFATGGAFEIQSGWWNETLQFGLAGYTSQELHGPTGRGGTGLLTGDQDSISVLGELWARAKFDAFTLQAGRSDINLPYLNRNDSRMIPQTFEFAGLRYAPRKGLRLGVGHFSQVKQRDSDEFIPMSEAAGIMGPSRGVTTAALHWDASESLDLAVFNHYGWDTYNTFYTELQWHGPGLRLPVDWKVGFQFTDQHSVGDELLGEVDTQQYGAKFAAQYKRALITLAVTKTSNHGSAGVRNDWGGSPSYLSSMISDFDRPGELAGRLTVQTDLSPLVPGLSTAVSMGAGDTDHGPDQRRQEELNLTLDYKPPGVENLWLRVRGAWNDRDGDQTEDYRAILNYERTF